MHGDGVLSSYVARIEAFTESLLRPYLERISDLPALAIAGKEFNDAVWGTITLQSAEVVVLDSPILQRLRRIRQLGVAQLVYPGANHTRLEHSLGVTHQVTRLISAVNAHKGEPHFGGIDESWERILRMAALCHDVGHGLMSHVIENALRSDEACEDVILAFQRQLEKDTASQLSEIAAYYIVRSAAFRQLITHANRIGGRPEMAEMPDRVSECIVGISSDDDYPLIHEAVSGPFDCDKLDYMTRDAMMCGVPVVTDVTRLTQKIRAVSLQTSDLPDHIADAVSETGRPHTIVAVARSGASTLHEVSLGRSLMHDKIYRHHKVRAAEAMVAAVVAQIGSVLDDYSPMLPLSMYDDEFLSLDAGRLAELTERGAVDCQEQELTVAADIARRIRERDLFVRAFAFSQKMPSDPYKNDPAQRRSIEQLIRDTDDGDSRADITRAIVARIQDMLSALGRASELDDVFPDADALPYIRIDPPIVKKTTVTDTDQTRAYLVDHDHKLVSMGVVSAETRGWADAYINTRDVGYVFCPREIAALVHLATEVVFRVDHNVHVSPTMHSYAKAGSADTNDLRTQLLNAGYYNDLPSDLRPLPAFLRSAGAKARIQAAAAQFAGYMGPISETDRGKLQGGAMNDGRIRDFVAQFDDSELALRLVERTRLLTRGDVTDAIRGFLSVNGENFSRPAFVPIGQAKDGSSILTYFSGDIAPQFDAQVLSLGDAVASNRPLIFIDDFIGRGSSIVSVFQSYFGAEDTEHLHEERPPALADDVQELLRNRPLGIVTAVGSVAGRAHIQAQLSALGLHSTIYSHADLDELPTVDEALNGVDGDRADQFRAELRTIGRQLIGDDDAEKAEGRALGYGNTGLLLITPFNTPTMTTTALWRQGNEQREWRPLFPRRSKP
ncbi:hypothetical protein NS183_05155 [Microbacterium testaceum]|uniref:phosphoribosyltransferase-like protein n=1 Tax=Microbacterium testaceum TaxID=2033 RepID=UPI000734E985|nr:HD domain-containing protein [Microbacterium testaceum]KTS91270.1 hypothetical protein NS183_05155 [Microbacterium testaceum]